MNAHQRDIVYKGEPLDKASRALILLHGRGGSAEDIFGISDYLDVEGFAIVIPQATNHTWYPQSFLAPPKQNEPWLSSAITWVHSIIDDISKAGIAKENIYVLGFSQGACLALESVARQSGKFGGVVAFTGGLIGDTIYRDNYPGQLSGTPVYIGSSDVDPHVPVSRVYASVNVLQELGAVVDHKIFAGMGHTINGEELAAANTLLQHRSYEIG